MILIVTNRADPHADLVASRLDAMGFDYFRFDTDTVPACAELTVEFRGGRPSCQLATPRGRIDLLADVRTVWFRRPTTPLLDFSDSFGDRRWIRAEWDAAFRSVWRLLDHCFWINPYDAYLQARCKPVQLAAAAGCGLVIPRTIVTSDPRDALAFADTCKGGMVYKTFEAHARTTSGGIEKGIYSSLVDLEDLRRRANDIQHAPCLFQARVPRLAEVRATVVGNTIFADEISGAGDQDDGVDWRRDIERRSHRAIDLPPVLEKAVHRLMARLGLVFGCIDLIKTPSGEYVFLEINPNGQWYWVEQMTGLPLLEAFVALLLKGPSSLYMARKLSLNRQVGLGRGARRQLELPVSDNYFCRRRASERVQVAT